jgi:hypothetical protein
MMANIKKSNNGIKRTNTRINIETAPKLSSKVIEVQRIIMYDGFRYFQTDN